MKQSAHIQAAIEVLVEIEEKSQIPADQVSADYFKSRRYIGSKDRRAIAQLAYGILRHRSHCDWWAMRRAQSPLTLSPSKAARVRMLAYLWVYEKVERAEIGILFSGDKYAPARLDDKERKLFSVEMDDVPAPPWVQGEYPEWLHSRLQDQYGEDVVQMMQTFLPEAPVDLRVNGLKANRDQVQEELAKEGIESDVLPSTPWGLRCKKRHPLSQNKLFRDGLFEVQDEGSQLLALMVGAQPGEAIVDLCAGAGGKTCALAAEMKNKGRLVATDVAEWRLKRAKERLKRAGAHNVECRPLETLKDKWLKRQKQKFDKVLVDAPCTGTGTWRRNPDQKWRLKLQDLDELPRLQGQILEAAAKLVKPGGKLIYGTCSILREENEDVVQAFLKGHPEYQLVKDLRLSPHTTQTDGFFGAVLERKSTGAK